jgi:prepilin-type N-terminal cleavage/methylation domain-containing protein
MRNRRHPSAIRSQRGFTLSEILVTTAIFAIIMIAALAVYDQSNKVFKGSTEAADMQQSTRIGFDKLVSDVRMAGFDYNRGGLPTNSWEAPQPDEQIEYAGPAAIAFRSNFNYNTQAANGNGLELSITPKNATGQNIFPFVTTNNSEIVIYALRSTDASKNIEKISFYVDDYSPRSVFPSTIDPPPAAGTTSKKEHLLVMGPTTCATCGIDTTNANPPYTLYRVTVADVLAGSMGTPVAENIRSMNFTYYSDALGKTLLTNPDNSAIDTGRNADGTTFTATNTGAIGGAGQFDPDSVGTTTDFADRDKRSVVQSIRIDLVGMNATPDIQGYTNTTETIAAIKSYRQYALSSLIVPRNLGKTGFPEPVYAPPGPPTITGMCVGYCGAPKIYWSAPVGGGPVEKYEISWDSNSSGSFGAPHVLNIIDPNATEAQLPDFGTEDLSVTWYYRIAAMNSNGSSPYSALYSVKPQNDTTPKIATNLVASTTAGGGAPAAQPNQIAISWTSPTQNQSPKDLLTCSGSGGSTNGVAIPAEEIVRYKIYRGITDTFGDPSTDSKTIVALDYSSGSQPPRGNPGSNVNWLDNVNSNAVSGPANCVQYYYRIEAANRCRTNPLYNITGSTAVAVSAVNPPFGTTAIGGYANGTGTPVAPIALAVDVTSSCSGASANCTIKINWPRVVTDTTGATIGVDTYRITRRYRVPAVSGIYIDDTSFNSGSAYKDVTGYSQLSGGTLSFTDNTAPKSDPSSTPPNLPKSYEYVVQAVSCGTPGAASPAVQFPTPCTGTPNITASGIGVTGTGDSPASPYSLNTGDQIITTQPTGVTYTNVTYSIYAWPGGTPVGLPSSSAGSGGVFTFTWADLTSGSPYLVTITATDNSGCTSTFVKYVTQQTIAPCAFDNIATPPVAVSGSGSSGRNNEFVSLNGDIISTSESITMTQVTVTWNDPRTPPNPKTYTATFDAMQWTSGTTVASLDTFSGTSTTTSCCPLVPTANQVVTRPIPTLPAAPAGSASASPAKGFKVRLQWSHPSTGGEKDFSDTGVNPAPQKSPVKKLCIAYTIPSEPGVTKKCNLVGQALTTANPNNCD